MTRVSVVIPAHNLEDFIVSTVESVLAQTEPADEILVIDDGSTDATAARVEAMRRGVRLIRAPHAGAGAARNRGIDAASGEWIAFLDGDDLWLPQKLERLRATIAAHPEATIVAHDIRELDESGAMRDVRLHEWYDPGRPLLPQLYHSNFFATSAVAVRRTALGAARFDETLPASQDIDLWLHLAREGKLVFLPETLETYRRRAASISSRGFERYRCVLRIAHRHAPHVAAITGSWRARLLRLRLVAIAHRYALAQRLPWRARVKQLGVALRAPWEVLRALAGPLT